MVEMAWLALGGFLGAASRYAVQSFVSARWSSKWPIGTFAVNVVGSFLLGWIATSGIDGTWVLFGGTGFMGAFTTFSTFQLESLRLFQNAEGKTGLMYLGLSFLLGLGAAWLGIRTGMWLSHGPN